MDQLAPRRFLVIAHAPTAQPRRQGADQPSGTIDCAGISTRKIADGKPSAKHGCQLSVKAAAKRYSREWQQCPMVRRSASSKTGAPEGSFLAPIPSVVDVGYPPD
jgi:hypothetical protein